VLRCSFVLRGCLLRFVLPQEVLPEEVLLPRLARRSARPPVRLLPQEVLQELL
jgi:hypothetical protein